MTEPIRPDDTAEWPPMAAGERHTAGDWLAILRQQFPEDVWIMAVVEEYLILDQLQIAKAAHARALQAKSEQKPE